MAEADDLVRAAGGPAPATDWVGGVAARGSLEQDRRLSPAPTAGGRLLARRMIIERANR